jgi:hypothetical protein
MEKKLSKFNRVEWIFFYVTYIKTFILKEHEMYLPYDKLS